MIVEPENMEELVYFTKRQIGDGKTKAWVYRREGPKCNKALMGKPVDKKTGKPKIRANEYVCPECSYTVDKEEYEDTLTCEIKYKCPKCKHEGELEEPFKWKNTKVFDVEEQKDKAAKAIKFKCENCEEVIAITKKMK